MVGFLPRLIFTLLMLKEVLGAIEENVCSICTCSGTTVNCRSRRLNQTFGEASWLGIKPYQYTEAIFDNNKIGHLTVFPVLPFGKLSFKNNRLVKIDSKAFVNLAHLEELYLSENELTSDNLLPDIFEGPFDAKFYLPLKLKTLDLNNNELHTLHQDVFQHLPWLERLYLRQNPFKTLDKSTVVAIASLPYLKVLDLSYTKLKDLPIGFLHISNNLFELVLKGNLFKEIPSDVLVEGHHLKILNLNENPIQVLSTERPFPEMPSLEQLHISFMPNLTRIEEGSLSRLKNLDYLYCRMNEKLSYISPKALTGENSEKGRPSIVKLDLSDNNLRYIDRELVAPFWNKIRHINILGNPLVCDCENQWIVSELVPLMMNLSSAVSGLECAEPSAMKGQRLVSLYRKNYTMRCLDLYGNHPENDGPVLISIFVVIIVLLIISLGVVVWLKNNNTCRQGGRVNYQRAFYKPTELDDVDKY